MHKNWLTPWKELYSMISISLKSITKIVHCKWLFHLPMIFLLSLSIILFSLSLVSWENLMKSDMEPFSLIYIFIRCSENKESKDNLLYVHVPNRIYYFVAIIKKRYSSTSYFTETLNFLTKQFNLRLLLSSFYIYL